MIFPLLAWGVWKRTHHSSIVLKVQEYAVCPPPWFALPYNDCWHDLLPQLWLSLLDCCHDHVANTGSWESVQSRTNTLDGDDVEVTGARVVTAIHDGTADMGVSSCILFLAEAIDRGRVWRLTLGDRESFGACYRSYRDCEKLSVSNARLLWP
jgi:hypothetical protein